MLCVANFSFKHQFGISSSRNLNSSLIHRSDICNCRLLFMSHNNNNNNTNNNKGNSRDTMVSSWLGQLVCLHVDFSQVEAIRAHWSRAAIDEANVEWVCEYWLAWILVWVLVHSHTRCPLSVVRCALLLPQIERVTGLWNVQAKLICLSRGRKLRFAQLQRCKTWAIMEVNFI